MALLSMVSEAVQRVRFASNPRRIFVRVTQQVFDALASEVPRETIHEAVGADLVYVGQCAEPEVLVYDPDAMPQGTNHQGKPTSDWSSLDVGWRPVEDAMTIPTECFRVGEPVTLTAKLTVPPLD